MSCGEYIQLHNSGGILQIGKIKCTYSISSALARIKKAHQRNQYHLEAVKMRFQFIIRFYQSGWLFYSVFLHMCIIWVEFVDCTCTEIMNERLQFPKFQNISGIKCFHISIIYANGSNLNHIFHFYFPVRYY